MRNMNNISELVKYAFVTLLGTLCLAGCGQDEKIGLNATDSVAPGLPTNIEVENINGGAIIRYTPPKDDDLLCVVASYMKRNLTSRNLKNFRHVCLVIVRQWVVCRYEISGRVIITQTVSIVLLIVITLPLVGV